MIFWRDLSGLGAAAVATGAIGAMFILPAVHPEREPLGSLPGTVRSDEVRGSKLRAGGSFDGQPDRGETVQVRAEEVLVPGDRVCLRAVRRGHLIKGFLVAVQRCRE